MAFRPRPSAPSGWLACVAVVCVGPATWFNVARGGDACEGNRSGGLAGVGTAAAACTSKAGALRCPGSVCDAGGDKKEVAN